MIMIIFYNIPYLFYPKMILLDNYSPARAAKIVFINLHYIVYSEWTVEAMKQCPSSEIIYIGTPYIEMLFLRPIYRTTAKVRLVVAPMIE